MNPHIELVKKWLSEPESVSLEELKENKKAAWDASIYAASSAIGYAAYAAADAAYWYAKAAYVAAKAAYWAGDAAYWAAYVAADDAEAAYWRSEAIKHVKKWEELNK